MAHMLFVPTLLFIFTTALHGRLDLDWLKIKGQIQLCSLCSFFHKCLHEGVPGGPGASLSPMASTAIVYKGFPWTTLLLEGGHAAPFEAANPTRITKEGRKGEVGRKEAAQKIQRVENLPERVRHRKLSQNSGSGKEEVVKRERDINKGYIRSQASFMWIYLVHNDKRSVLPFLIQKKYQFCKSKGAI